MKNKIIRTYSKKKEYIKLKNDRFEETLGKQNVSDKSVTGLYAETIENCKKSFTMGNKHDRERLMSNNETNDEQQWTTVETFTKSQISIDEKSAVLRRMTPLKPLIQPKRWSESRKVHNPQTDLTPIPMKRTSSKLRQYTKNLINIYEDKVPTSKQEKLNSTVCNGGNTLSKSFLDSFSPIKKKTLRKPHKPLQILRQNLRNRATPVTTTPIARLEKQIPSQDKVKKWLMTSPINLPGEINNEVSEIAEEENEKEVFEKNEKQMLEENHSHLSPSNSSEISPIPSEICFKESGRNENVSPQVVSLETKRETQISTKPKVDNNNNNNNNNNHDNDTAVSVRPKRVKRKKRKRICMPANWRGKLSPQEKVTKNNKNIINGKELKIQLNPLTGFKVKIKEDGNVTFDQCPYKLRSRSIRKSLQTAVVNDFKEIENSNTKKENRSSNGVTIGKKAHSMRASGGNSVSLENSLSEVNEEEEEEEEEAEEEADVIAEVEKEKHENSILQNDESPPMDIANMTHSKRKLNFAPKRLLANMTATEDKTNQSVMNDDVVENGSLNVTASSIGDVTSHCLSNNDTTLEPSTKNKSEYRDTSGRSTCVLQKTTSDSGVRLSSFASDSKSCVSDFLQASF